MEGGFERINHRQEPLSLREEFRCRRFGLQHDLPIDFLRSQWQSKPRSPFFLAYRWLLGACFGTGFVSNTVIYFQRGHTFIYLTNLGFLLCAITSVSGALLVTVYHCKEESWVPPRCLVKTYWACYWINLCVAHLVSIIYWACIYPSDRVASNPTYVSTLFNIWTHAMQLICFTIDHFVVAQPARLLHFVYPIGFCFLYLGFTAIFYFAGGRDLKGHRYIYKILDYSKPRKVVCTVALVTLMLTACSTLQYGVYRLRTFVARKCGKLLV